MSVGQYRTKQLTITKSYVMYDSRRIEMGNISAVSQPPNNPALMILGVICAALSFIAWEYNNIFLILMIFSGLTFIAGFIPPKIIIVTLMNGATLRLNLFKERDFGRALATLQSNLREYSDKTSLTQGQSIRVFTAEIGRNPEEQVRQYVLKLLTSEFCFSASDIASEFPIKLGSSQKRTDIVVFLHGKTHIQANIYIIVECKRADQRNDAAAQRQLESYLAACINARYGVAATYRWRVLEKINQDGHFTYVTKPALLNSNGTPYLVNYSPVSQ